MGKENRLEVKQEEIDKIDLRSEEVREMLGQTPHWVIASGQGYLLLLIVIAMLLTWFIHYPDIIDAPVVLTAQNPPVSIISRGQGYLTLWATDNEELKEGQYLGYLTTTADVKTVLTLKQNLDAFKLKFYKHREFLYDYEIGEGANLGELQDGYNSFAKGILDYQLANEQQSFKRQIDALNQQIASYNFLIEQTEEQNAIKLEELKLSAARYRMDSSAYASQALSKADYEERKRGYLAAQRDYKSASLSITNTKIAVNQSEGRVQELVQQEQKQNKDYINAIEASMNRLDGSLKSWEQSYMLTAPVDGKAAFFKYLTDHQFIKAGEEILTIIPASENYFGSVKAPVGGSGKIQVGQKVRIKFADYPSEEYGIVAGIIQNISLLPRENVYTVTIQLPHGLTTGYGKKLEYRQEMSGMASIITKDYRLFERVFFNVTKWLDGKSNG